MRAYDASSTAAASQSSASLVPGAAAGYGFMAQSVGPAESVSSAATGGEESTLQEYGQLERRADYATSDFSGSKKKNNNGGGGGEKPAYTRLEDLKRPVAAKKVAAAANDYVVLDKKANVDFTAPPGPPPPAGTIGSYNTINSVTLFGTEEPELLRQAAQLY